MSDAQMIARGVPSPLAGIGNVFRHESRIWWRGRRWWVQLLLWTGLLVGILRTFLWIAGQAATGAVALDPSATDVNVVFPQFIGFALTLSVIGVTVLTQGIMLDERRTGTLEWLLVKPVTRTGVVIGKFLAHLLPVLLVFVVGPWTGLYLLLSSELGAAWPIGPFLAATAMAALTYAFTVALVTLLGTWFDSRALVVGLPIALALLYDVVPTLLPALRGRLPLPWELPNSAVHVAAGEPLVSLTPLIATLVWIALALTAAAWRFNRQEIL